ncbi:hypothetical protein [Kocuria palustris]
MTISPQSTPIQPPTGFEKCFPDDTDPAPEYMHDDMVIGVSYDVTWNERDGVKLLAGGVLHVQPSDIIAAVNDLLALYVKVVNAEAEHAANVARAEGQA